ncbi:MAG TPA: hypothetical protein VGD34_14970 [Kribbella sp.]|jgi:hypothetical protein
MDVVVLLVSALFFTAVVIVTTTSHSRLRASVRRPRLFEVLVIGAAAPEGSRGSRRRRVPA